jgi:hypothetical protein
LRGRWSVGFRGGQSAGHLAGLIQELDYRMTVRSHRNPKSNKTVHIVELDHRCPIVSFSDEQTSGTCDGGNRIVSAIPHPEAGSTPPVGILVHNSEDLVLLVLIKQECARS